MARPLVGDVGILENFKSLGGDHLFTHYRPLSLVSGRRGNFYTRLLFLIVIPEALIENPFLSWQVPLDSRLRGNDRASPLLHL